MPGCSHKNEKNETKTSGNEVITVTKCTDCGAIITSSRRRLYGGPK